MPGPSRTYGRNPKINPFAANSIWNTPIGSGAVYGNFKGTTNASGGEQAQTGVRSPGITLDGSQMPNGTTTLNLGSDTNFIVTAAPTDPLRTVGLQSGWDLGRGVDTRLESAFSGGPTPWQIRIPDSFIVPDNYRGNTPNYSAAIIQPDGTIHHFNIVCRPNATDAPSPASLGTLVSAITTAPASGTTETITLSASPSPGLRHFLFQIGTENFLDKTLAAGTVRTVERGSYGSTSAVHSAGAAVTCLNKPYPDNFHGTPAWKFITGVTQGQITADATILSTGIYGGHGGSGMNAYGALMLGDLTGPDPIKHALSMDINGAEYLYYDGTSGHVWPAPSNDGGAYLANYYNGYHGHYPAVRMGALLACNPSATETSLGLTTIPGKKIFHAAQDFGIYIVDDTGWASADINIMQDAATEFGNTYGYSFNIGYPGAPWGCSNVAWYNDLIAILGSLQVISNNGPTTVGGGGTPRVTPPQPILTI